MVAIYAAIAIMLILIPVQQVWTINFHLQWLWLKWQWLLVQSYNTTYLALIVETLGIWPPFAVKSLKNTAARTTAKNGLPTKKEFCNLIQQLSVCV